MLFLLFVFVILNFLLDCNCNCCVILVVKRFMFKLGCVVLLIIFEILIKCLFLSCLKLGLLNMEFNIVLVVSNKFVLLMFVVVFLVVLFMF